jgi:hypothetical protein
MGETIQELTFAGNTRERIRTGLEGVRLTQIQWGRSDLNCFIAVVAHLSST